MIGRKTKDIQNYGLGEATSQNLFTEAMPNTTIYVVQLHHFYMHQKKEEQ